MNTKSAKTPLKRAEILIHERRDTLRGGDSQVMELTILKYTLVDFVRDCRTGYHYEKL